MNGQDYILASTNYTYKGNYNTHSKLHNNHLYVFGNNDDPNFPTTDSSMHSGTEDLFFLKYDALTLNLIEAKLMAPFRVSDVKIHGSYFYLFGNTDDPSLPSIPGSVHSGGHDLYIQKMDFDGNILQGAYLGGSKSEHPSNVEIVNGIAHIVMSTYSSDFPVTNGTSYKDKGDIGYAQVDLATFNKIQASYIGGSNWENSHRIEVYDDKAFIAYYSNSPDVQGATTSTLSGYYDVVITSIDINSGNIIKSVYLGGINREILLDLHVAEGHVFIEGESRSPNFTITNGSTPDVGLFLARFDTSLYLQSSAYVPRGDDETPPNVKYYNGFIYMTTANEDSDYRDIVKLDLNGNVVWAYTGIFSSSFDAGMRIYNDKIYYTINTNTASLITTNGSSGGGNKTLYLTILSLDGKLEFAGYYQENGYAFTPKDERVLVEGSNVWLVGVGNDCFPTTVNCGCPLDNSNLTAMVIEFCPNSFSVNPSPKDSFQIVCKNGLVSPIIIDSVITNGADLPILESCGSYVIQPAIEASYQWQAALNKTGPWTNIPGAINLHHTPTPVSVTTYFRRLATQNECCGGTVISASDIHCVIVGPDDAPIVDAGGIYNTCPNVPIIMNAALTGGTPPFQYEWTLGNDTTVLSNTTSLLVNQATGPVIYTLLVTDGNGCQQLDQTILNVYSAEAGPDVVICEGQPGKTIGGPAIPGLSGVVYDWTPTQGLSCTNCPNPIVTATVPTQYTLTLTLPISGIGTCTTTDQVTVTPVSAPSPNFAGPDTTLCSGNSFVIGELPEPGFSYQWTPDFYLNSDIGTPRIFKWEQLAISHLNPINYTLAAEKLGCTWFDDVEVHVIIADAGEPPVCSPVTTIGTGDQTPYITENWQWTQLSGDGMIIGPTNNPTANVSASDSLTSYYELAVSYNGITCKDTTYVPPFDSVSANGVSILQSNCPSFQLNGDVCFTAIANTTCTSESFVYSWSPQVGLDTFYGQTVCLTDTVFRTYTVTMTNVQDTSDTYTASTVVNDPVIAIHHPPALDTGICRNEPATIGFPPIPGYSYEWDNKNYLSNPYISNPTTLPLYYTEQFVVIITDNATGCSKLDTSTVSVSSMYDYNPKDAVLCDLGYVTIGNGPVPNVLYSWSPASANWQNGTDEFDAQPDVLVAINTTFVVTKTDTISGCSFMDTVNVIVGNPVLPFQLPDISFCPSQGSVQLGTGVPLGFDFYRWDPGYSLSNRYDPMPVVGNPSINGQLYTLTVSNQSGCSYVATQLLVPTVNVPQVVSPLFLCHGTSVQIGSPSNPTGSGISYSWDPVTNLDDPTSPNPTLTATIPGTTNYEVTVDDNGCISYAQVSVTVDPPVAGPGPQTVCEGSCVNIGIPSAPGLTYVWTPVTGLDDPSSSNPLACVNSDMVYSLLVIEPGGCHTTFQVPVFTNNEIAPLVSIPPLSTCIGSVGDSIIPIISPPGNYLFDWTPNNSTLIYPNSPTPEVVLGSTGTYTYDVTITNPISGCATQSSVDVVVSDCSDPCLNLDICMEISANPFHGLAMLDCDEDGVTNADECLDGTNPLDPCDFVSTSITLPVTADQSGCPPTCPDLSPTVRLVPGNISGNSLIQVAVKLTEIHNVDTDGSVISVRIPSDPRLLFVWDIGLTFAAFTTVQNADWNYLGDNGVFHNWTYNGPGLIINGQSTSAFGFNAFYDPQATNGQTTITATVVPFSGGECNLTNNSDSELLIYFH